MSFVKKCNKCGNLKTDEPESSKFWADIQLDSCECCGGFDQSIFKVEILDDAKDELEHDPVNNPNHYQILPGVEVYDVRKAILLKASVSSPAVLDCWSRAWEYLTRMWGKDGIQDAKKAQWYLNKMIEEMESKNENCK